MNQSCLSPFSVESDLLAFVIVFQPSQEMGARLLGKWREAFLSQALPLTHPCGSQSVWSQLLSLPFSLSGLFLELFPLSPSPMV